MRRIWKDGKMLVFVFEIKKKVEMEMFGVFVLEKI